MRVLLGAGFVLASACATAQTFPDPVACLSPAGEALPRPDVWPVVSNRGDVARALEREYRPELRRRGITGRTEICILVDELGSVQATRVERSSGIEAIDRAAIAVVSVMRFSPATLANQPTPVWIIIPVSFSLR
jgi:protein TonB